MGISQDGNSLIITDCTITLNNAFDPTTGAATITITPAGGLSTLPGLLEGRPGPPSMWRNVNLTQVAYGDSLPSPAASVTEISPGAPGVPSIWDLNLWLNSGAPGDTGSYSIGGASDLVGSLTSWVTLIYNAATSKFNPAPLPLVGIYVPSSYTALSGNDAAGTSASLTVPSQSYDWYPICVGWCPVTGTANTTISLTATLASTTGTPVAGGNIVTGSGTAFLLPSITEENLSAALVAAGSSKSIYFQALQSNSGTTDDWSTPDTGVSFLVAAAPAGTPS